MRILTRDQILKLLEEGLMRIEPFSESNLGEVTYDLRLANEFVMVEPHMTPIIDPEDPSTIKRVNINAKEVYIQPHAFVLGRSLEWIELPNDVLAMISGKSSLARLGIQVETAYILHPGHKGYVVLEINNRNSVPIKLKYMMPIAQLIFFQLDREVTPYFKIGTFGVQKSIKISTIKVNGRY